MKNQFVKYLAEPIYPIAVGSAPDAKNNKEK